MIVSGVLALSKGTTVCPFAWLTGTACPFCGLTRAFVALLRADFGDAWAYHPLVFVVIVIAIAIVAGRLSRQRASALLTLGVIAFVGTWLVRLATGSLPPV